MKISVTQCRITPDQDTDETIDERIERDGGEATAEALRQEQQEKRESRNPLQNFFYGNIMGENAEYERQIKRAEESGVTGSGTQTPPVRSTTPVLPGVRPKGTGTEGDPVVEGDDREYLLRLMLRKQVVKVTWNARCWKICSEQSRINSRW